MAKRTNYILIDQENVSSLEFGEMAGHPVRVLIFAGKTQTRLPIEDVEKMLQHKERVELIRMNGSGHNALDFHIAWYAGRISVEDPNAHIHIVSQDKGFDPLIEHLKARQVSAQRFERVGDIKILLNPDATACPLTQRVHRVQEMLQASAQTRPRKRKSLTASIRSWCGKELTAADVAAIIEELKRTEKMQIGADDMVSYSL